MIASIRREYTRERFVVRLGAVSSVTLSIGMGFSPSWYVRSPHVQTMWGRLVRDHSLVKLRRETLVTPDDDDLILDHLDGPVSGFRFILLHGLEGSSFSVYIQGLLALIERAGHPAVAMNFRSCARELQNHHAMIPNRRPRFYHSGATEDLDFLLETLRARHPDERFVLVGASLGGNQVLKFLGEGRDTSRIAAAATMSVPYDLAAGSKSLESPLGRFYTWTFHLSLKKKVEAAARRFPEAAAVLDLPRVRRARTFREFDHFAVAPLHGFTGADDYYARASSIDFVDKIKVPTFCLSAEDDPFLPAAVLDEVSKRASSFVTLERTRNGGHCGFVAGGRGLSSVYWGEARLIEWLLKNKALAASG